MLAISEIQVIGNTLIDEIVEFESLPTYTGSNPVLTTAQFFLLLLGSADTKKKAKSRHGQVVELVDTV